MAAAAIRLDGPINEPQGAMYRTQMHVIKTWPYTHKQNTYINTNIEI